MRRQDQARKVYAVPNSFHQASLQQPPSRTHEDVQAVRLGARRGHARAYWGSWPTGGSRARPLYIASRAGGGRRGEGSGQGLQKKELPAACLCCSKPDGNRDDEHGRFVDRRLQLAAALLVLLRSGRHRRELRHDRQQPAVPGQGDRAVQGQGHHRRPAVPPGHGRPRGAPGLGPGRRPRHPERGPRPPGLRPFLRRVLGARLRAALRRRRPLPLRGRGQRGRPGRPRPPRPPGHAEPRVRAPRRGARRRRGHHGRVDVRAGVLVPAVARRLLGGGAADDGAHRVVPGVPVHAAARQRVPLLRLLRRPGVGAARLRAAAVRVRVRRWNRRHRDGRRGLVRQHVRRDRGRRVRGAGEGGRAAGAGGGGVGDRVAVGRRRGGRQRGERGGVREQRGAPRRERARHAAAAREARGGLRVRLVQREPEARGRGAALRDVPARHDRGVPRRLHGRIFLVDERRGDELRYARCMDLRRRGIF